MAGSSLLALIDDIATVLDDISVMTKVAAKKTAGVLGDDLALNAEQVAGVRAERELPVVWAVAKGSLVNKAILVPAALAVSAVAPWAILPLLMLGGAYLSFEGFEKLAHRFLHAKSADANHHAALTRALEDPAVDLVTLERAKIKGAVRTDFVLSAEIIVITLGIVAAAPFLSQVTVLAGIAVIMTLGVYGLVAVIVKLDDAGLFLSRLTGAGHWDGFLRGLGRGLLAAAPRLMKVLSVVGTAAMFLVGGGIITHGIPAAHHLIEGVTHAAVGVPMVGAVLGPVTPLLVDVLVGVLTGALVLLGVTLAGRLWSVIRRWGGSAMRSEKA
ncbi:DUF808 domain-containing protein [uncultured Thiodictyon sp.]|jgi:predicted DNA repair protein MutK|uniref:DUF808 domain-containing protein n=1 Tax=uncultured Thiodictyon sp. TaxID=1846217 RepID=UPI0025E83734|nr:DUF808 domain-containing protein [uncultured Thiodictyon sp.]